MALTEASADDFGTDAVDNVYAGGDGFLPPGYQAPIAAVSTVSGFGTSTVGEMPNGTITAILCQTYGVMTFFCDLDPHPDDWQIMTQMMQACVGSDGRERNLCLYEQGVDIFVCVIASDSPWGIAARSMALF